MAAGDPGSPARYYSSTAVETSLQSSIPSQSQGQSYTSFIVASISGFPTSFPYTLIVDPDTSKEEVITVTSGAGTTLTVTRGSDNTQAVAHSAGTVVRHGISGREFRESENHIAARGYDIDQAILDAANQTHVHGIATGDGVVVGTTKAQTLTNKVYSSGTVTGAFTATSATFTGGTFTSATVTSSTVTSSTIASSTLTGSFTASAATFVSPTISGSPVITGLSSAGMVDSSATPKNYVDSILGSATSAATSAASAAASATAAATSATSAAASASAAAASESASATSAGAAATSATSAATSATSAATSATSAAASASAAATSAASAAASTSAAAASASAAAVSATSAATSATSAAASATAAAASAASVDATATAATELRQYGAEGSILNNIPTRVHPAENLLRQAAYWIDSNHTSSSSQTVDNLGWTGNLLPTTLGSSTAADSNDPKFLDWTGTNYVYLPGVSSNRLTVPDSAELDITGDLEVIINCTIDTLSVNIPLVIKSATDNLSYAFRIDSSNRPVLVTSPDGTTGSAQTITATAALTTVYTAGNTIWIKATIDVDNGSSGNDVKFYTSNDGVTYTQLGSTVTTAGTTSIFAGTADTWIGQNPGSPSQVLTGKVFGVEVYNGIGGTKVLDVDTSVITSGAATSFFALSGQTVTINRSTSGRKSVAVVHPCWLFGTDDYMEVNNRYMASGTYLYLPGITLNYAYAADAAPLDITGDIDLRAKVALDDWTPSVANTLIAKGTSASGQRSYHLTVDTTGTLSLVTSPDGTTANSITYTSTVAPTITDGATKWVRATLDVDNGASGKTATFYTSDDGSTWTQLGDVVTTAGTTSIYSGTSPLHIGGLGSAAPARGKFFRAQVYNGIAGTLAFDANFETSITSLLQSTFTESSANAATVTINRSGSAYCSAGITGTAGYLYPGATNTFSASSVDYLNFGASDSFTLMAITRQWNTKTVNVGIIFKSTTTQNVGPGWGIRNSSNIYAVEAQDGTNRATDSTTGTFVAGTLYNAFGVRNAGSTVDMNINGSSDGTTVDTTGNLNNFLTMRIGRNESAIYADMELVAVAVFRRALTAGEIATINSYYAGRVGA